MAAWFATVPAHDLHVSVLVLGEIRRGITRLERRDPEQAAALDQWLDGLQRGFADRTIPIDAEIAERWGGLDAGSPIPVEDGLMAATALVRGLTFVTRNVADVERAGVVVLNPWTG